MNNTYKDIIAELEAIAYEMQSGETYTTTYGLEDEQELDFN